MFGGAVYLCEIEMGLMSELEVKWHCFVRRVAPQKGAQSKEWLPGESVPHLPAHGIWQLSALDGETYFSW